MTAADAPLRFLVVDDDPDVREVLTRMLERLGHAVDVAGDGLQAVEALAVESYDVVLLDQTMPRMTGEDVVRWLRDHPDRAEGLRVVIVSAWVGELRGHFQELGVNDVLAKPLRLQQLRELVAETRTGFADPPQG